MRRIMTAAILALATMTGSTSVQAKPPSGGGSSGSGTSHSNHSSQGQSQSGKGQMDHKDSKHGDSKQGRSGSERNYHTEHGKKFSHGYFYYGKEHSHWSYSCWFPRYSCECYYCPSACCWYYWCEPRCSYLPVTCIETAPPSVLTTVNVQNTNTAVANTGGPVTVADLPPIVPGGPSGSGPVQPFKGGPK